MADTEFTALVLAGRREGQVDPLAQAHGVADKCLVPVAGLPLIAHVLKALAAVPEIGRVIVSVNDPQILCTVEIAQALEAEGRLHAIASAGNLADSVIEAAAYARFPLLITTADNVLLTPEAVGSMRAGAAQSGADAAIAFARQGDIHAAHPEGQRRFYAFADGGYSNCNCYWLANPLALAAAEAFRSGGRFRKNPMRIVKAFGLLNLIRFRLGRSTLAEALVLVSRRFSLSLRPVIFADGALAIDVDNQRTHRVAGEILERRRHRTIEVAAA